MQQFHIITRYISQSAQRAILIGGAIACLGLISPVAAQPSSAYLTDPSPTLALLAVGAHERALRALRDTGRRSGDFDGPFGDVQSAVAATMIALRPGAPALLAAASDGSGGSLSPDIVGALVIGGRSTGVSPFYLLRTARRESALEATAAADGTSARGLFQFIEQTWLSTVHRHGARHGLGHYASAILVGPTGIAEVRDPAARAAILALRFDPFVSARMAGELTAENRRALIGYLRRAPTDRELYAAHLLGVAGAMRLLAAAARHPSTPAAVVLPQAAAANPRLFFSKGAPISSARLLRALGNA